MRGVCLWRIRVEVFIQPQVFHAGAFFFFFSCVRGARNMTRRSCVVPAVGILSGLLLGVGIVLVVSQTFRTVMHNRLKKVIQVTFDTWGLFLKGHIMELFPLCVPLSLCVPYLQSQSRCKVYYFVCTRPAIHSLSLLQTSFIKPVETIGKGWVKMICFWKQINK